MENNELIRSIILVDEDENEIEFDLMDEFEFESERYIVLLPVDYDGEDLEYVILRDNGDGELVGIDEPKTLDRVFEEYQKRNSLDD